MKIFNKLLKQAAILLGGNLFSAGANFLAIIVLTQALSAHNFGVFVLLQTYILFMAALFNPQAWQGFIKFTALNESKLKQIITHTFKYDLLSAVAGTVITLSLAPYFLELMGLEKNYLATLQWMCAYIIVN